MRVYTNIEQCESTEDCEVKCHVYIFGEYKGVSRISWTDSLTKYILYLCCWLLPCSEFMHWAQCFCHAWKHFCNCINLHAGWSVIVPEFQVHPGNGALVTAISFLDTRRNRKGPIQASKGGWVPTAVFLMTKNSWADKAVCTSTVSWCISQPSYVFGPYIFGGFVPSHNAKPPGSSTG